MRLVALFAVLALACGCGSSPRDGLGRPVAERSDSGFDLNVGGREHTFAYVVIDGHEYLMMNAWSYHSVGITHSPKCPCTGRNIEYGGLNYVNGMYILDVSRENSSWELEADGQRKE